MDKLLKPCPFCGKVIETLAVSLQKLPRQIMPDQYSIRCSGCGATGPTGWSKDEAFDNWNRREVSQSEEEPRAEGIPQDGPAKPPSGRPAESYPKRKKAEGGKTWII